MAAVGDIGLKVQYKNKASACYVHARACVDQPITWLPHAHALCMNQHVVRIVYMPPVCHLSPHCPDQNHEMHDIWSVDSQENYSNCCLHEMSDFKAKMHQIRFRLGLPAWEAYSASQTP